MTYLKIGDGAFQVQTDNPDLYHCNNFAVATACIPYPVRTYSETDMRFGQSTWHWYPLNMEEATERNGVFVNQERQIDYGVLPSGYVDVLLLRSRLLPPFTVTKTRGSGNVKITKFPSSTGKSHALLGRVIDKALLGGADVQEFEITKTPDGMLRVSPIESQAKIVQRTGYLTDKSAIQEAVDSTAKLVESL